VTSAAHHIDRGLLAAHQLQHNGVDQAFFDQGLQAFGWLHGGIVRYRVLPVGSRTPCTFFLKDFVGQS
jgi:hypothetical protein